MNENLGKKIILALGLGFIVYYFWQRDKNNNTQPIQGPTEDTTAEDVTGNDSAKKNEEFADIGTDCELLAQILAAFDSILETNEFEVDSLYTESVKEKLDPVLEGTTHFYNENDGLRKSFLYDLARTFANLVDVEIYPREFSNQYTSGIISLGDKGTDVINLQELINKLSAENYIPLIEVNGTYDKETRDAASKIFAGTTALIDANKGAVSKEFVNNFTKILNNLTTIATTE